MPSSSPPSTATAQAAPATAAVARSRRVPSLDVLRGIAILGTLASNIWLFTAGLGAGASIVPLWASEVSSWIPNGKFLGLLTIMFGIGLEIQRQSALRAGRAWPGTYPIRAGLLFLDGLLNYILVVQFDVLRAYALTGFLVAFLLLTSERVQWWLIGIFFSVHLTVLAAMSAGNGGEGLQAVDGDDGADAGAGTATASLDALDQGGDTDGAAAIGTDGYWDDVRDTVATLSTGFDIHSEFFTIVLLGLGSFLLGAKLYRIGLFEAHRRRLRLWLIGVGFLVALPLDAALTFTSLGTGMFGGYSRYGAATGVALGILALVAEFYQRRPVGWIGRRLADVGMMALSCYLLQNIIGVVVQHTLVNSGRLATVDAVLGTYAFLAAISAVLVLFSWLWLRRFSRGPFEIVWNGAYRVLSRGR